MKVTTQEHPMGVVIQIRINSSMNGSAIFCVDN